MDEESLLKNVKVTRMRTFNHLRRAGKSRQRHLEKRWWARGNTVTHFYDRLLWSVWYKYGTFMLCCACTNPNSLQSSTELLIPPDKSLHVCNCRFNPLIDVICLHTGGLCGVVSKIYCICPNKEINASIYSSRHILIKNRHFSYLI